MREEERKSAEMRDGRSEGRKRGEKGRIERQEKRSGK